jgi:hypothetical protein
VAAQNSLPLLGAEAEDEPVATAVLAELFEEVLLVCSTLHLQSAKIMLKLE